MIVLLSVVGKGSGVTKLAVCEGTALVFSVSVGMAFQNIQKKTTTKYLDICMPLKHSSTLVQVPQGLLDFRCCSEVFFFRTLAAFFISDRVFERATIADYAKHAPTAPLDSEEATGARSGGATVVVCPLSTKTTPPTKSQKIPPPVWGNPNSSFAHSLAVDDFFKEIYFEGSKKKKVRAVRELWCGDAAETMFPPTTSNNQTCRILRFYSARISCRQGPLHSLDLCLVYAPSLRSLSTTSTKHTHPPPLQTF